MQERHKRDPWEEILDVEVSMTRCRLFANKAFWSFSFKGEKGRYTPGKNKNNSVRH